MAELESNDVEALFRGLFDANWKLDEILSYLRDEDDGEEEEEVEPDA